jgi:hypothetical protein
MNIPKITKRFETSLASSLSAAGTTFTTVSATDDDGNALSGLYALSIDVGNADVEDVIATVSGATWTIVYRGIDADAPNTEVTANKKAHRRGAPVVITDYPIMGVLRNILNGDDTLPNKLSYASNPTWTTQSNELVTVKKLEDTAIQGAADSSTLVKGITKMSVAPAVAATPIAVGDNDPRVPTQSENDALVGTSGTAVSGSNKLVDAADVASAATASKIARRNATGDVTVPSTPSASTDAASKAYADGKQATYKNGTTTRAGDTASGSQTIAHGLGATPRYIKITAIKNFGATTNTKLAQSFGTYNGSATATVYSIVNTVTPAHSVSVSTTNIINIDDDGAGNTQVATVAIDATNITLTWTKAGSPTSSTINIVWEAIA